MAFKLTGADKRKLVGVDARLVAVIETLAQRSPVRFMVVEGLRSHERQAALVAEGKSKTLKSKHLTGDAVDIAPLVGGRASWKWSDFTPLIKAAKEVAAEHGVALTFGYDWGWDAPHIEIKEG